MKYEYKVMTAVSSGDSFREAEEELLNTQGKVGWELVSVHVERLGEYTNCRYYLKREKQK